MNFLPRTRTWIFGLAIALTGVCMSTAIDPASAAGCKDDGSLQSCGIRGGISVAGNDRARSHHSATDTPITAFNVICTVGAASRIVIVGHAPIAVDAGACIEANKACATLDNGSPKVAFLSYERMPPASWNQVGEGCAAPAKPQVTAAEVRAQAVRMIPGASIGLAPHTATLVNIQTVMWVDAPAKRTLPVVRILGRQVSITIALTSVSWNFGDGGSLPDGSAGKVYDEVGAPCRTRECPGYFGHEYRHRGSVTVRATANWSATFTVDGGAAVSIPATIPGPPASSALQVKEARGVLVANPGEH